MQATYLACLVAAFVLFSLLLRWQPPGSRLMTPLFVLAAPWMAAVLARFLSAGLLVTVGGLMFLSGVPFAILGHSHPLVGQDAVWRTPREDQYFCEAKDWRSPFQAAGRMLEANGYQQVGLWGVSSDYLVWVVTDARDRGIRLEHVPAEPAASDDLASNPSFVLPYPAGEPFRPEAILAERCCWTHLNYGGQIYVRVWSEGPLAIYTPAR
jgi:hypothetical protein